MRSLTIELRYGGAAAALIDLSAEAREAVKAGWSEAEATAKRLWPLTLRARRLIRRWSFRSTPRLTLRSQLPIDERKHLGIALEDAFPDLE